MLGHLWLLCRVNARRALQRHLLHLGAQVWSLLLLLLLLRWLRRVRVVSTNGSWHTCGVAVVYGRLVAACAEFLRVARVQGVDAVRAGLALKAARGWRCAGAGVLVCGCLLRCWLTADDRLLWCLRLVLDASGDEVKGCRSVGRC
jgi:hypothetical protein